VSEPSHLSGTAAYGGFLWERHVLLARSMIFHSKVLERVTAMLQ
jgi:hypothetical protein